MLKMKKIGLLIIGILLLSSFFINCYAIAVPVTKENLNTALQELISSTENGDKYEINVSDNIITLTIDGSSYNMNYDLTGKPKFYLEIPIKQGMSYEEYKEQSSYLMLPIIGYAAVANIQGAEIQDAGTYLLTEYFSNSGNLEEDIENRYIVIDDTKNSSSGNIVNNSKFKTIYASEFGERVMEYVNAVYKNKKIVEDTILDSFEWTIEKQDIDATSCKLISSLTVNVDADFSKIKENVNKTQENQLLDKLDKNITKDNADYNITLKVGQKWRIETTDKISAHEISGTGYSFTEVSENCVEFYGMMVGKANGTITIGETKKTFYITIEENSENKKFDLILTKIETESTANTTNQDNTNKQEEKEPEKIQPTNNVSSDDTTTKETLPQTGISKNGYIVMSIVLVSLVIFGIKLKQYKDIK